jgi:hypothetical protein
MLRNLRTLYKHHPHVYSVSVGVIVGLYKRKNREGSEQHGSAFAVRFGVG